MDILATLDRLGVPGRVVGNEFSSRCPMHEQRTGKEDTHPSWSMNLTSGLHNCFSCGYRGSLFTLIRDLNGDVLDLEAARTWMEHPGLSQQVQLPDLMKPLPGIAYIDESLLARFYAPPAGAVRGRRITRESCERFGVLWDRHNGSWILPIRDPYTGGLLGWQEKGESNRRFVNQPPGVKKSHCLFGFDVFDQERMIVVESPLDVLRLWSEGVYGSVAVFGAVVSKQQLSLMTSAEEVVFALDNPNLDEAGKKSSKQLLQDTKGVLKSVRFFNYSATGAKDPGDMSREEILTGLETARSRAYGIGALV